MQWVTRTYLFLVVALCLGSLYTFTKLQIKDLRDAKEARDSPSEHLSWQATKQNSLSLESEDDRVPKTNQWGDSSGRSSSPIGRTEIWRDYEEKKTTKLLEGMKLSATKFFLVAPPESTSTLISNFTEKASKYYQNHLNEESAEMWLYRGFNRMTYEQGHTNKFEEADVVLIAGCLHLRAAIQNKKGKAKQNKRQDNHDSLVEAYRQEWSNFEIQAMRDKPHLVLIPSWNPSVSNNIGLKALISALQKDLGIRNLWSIGFERNEMWQGVTADRILPVPYVIRKSFMAETNRSITENGRISNFVFYAGDVRKNAKAWAGCHRDKLILSLQKNATKQSDDMDSTYNMDVRIVGKTNRLNQSEYNYRMSTSEFCLILCGDTPSSRSLTSAMISGCIPVRVGSRLRGLCEPPCHGGFGWKPTGLEYPHLPYPHTIPWDFFPEVNEQDFMDDGLRILNNLFRNMEGPRKQETQQIMEEVRSGWIYGWGDPVSSTMFGEAAEYIWSSFLSTLRDSNHGSKFRLL